MRAPESPLGPFWKLQVKGYLFDYPQIWTVASLIYKRQKRATEFVIPKIFFSESDFSTITPYIFIPIAKMFSKFSLKLNMANRRHLFELKDKRGFGSKGDSDTRILRS